MADPRTFDELVQSWDVEHPAVLLPARIETRFDAAAKFLRIRIYPDDICAETHEPLLTEVEAKAGEAYWDALWKSNKVEDEQAAWRMLVKRFGAHRTAWVVLKTLPTNLAKRPAGKPDIPRLPRKPRSWTQAAKTSVLPDRWIAIGYRPLPRLEVRAEGNPVKRGLVLTLSPSEEERPRTDLSNGLKIDDDILWTVDYNAALAAGMAINLPLDDLDLVQGFDRLIVVGAAGLDPMAGQSLLEHLFEAHHYSRGIEFLRQGTPTNNTQAGPSGFPPPDPDATVSFAIEQRGLKVANRDGERFAKALGLKPESVEHFGGADRDEYGAASSMAGALWPVTFGNFIRQLMAPAFDNQDFEIESARRYFIEHVKARGPYPACRVGAVPYGLLPVTSLRTFISSQGAHSQFERELPKALQNLLVLWQQGAERSPGVGRTGDPDTDLLAILGMDASTREVRVRNALGPGLVMNLTNTSAWPNIYRQLIQAADIYLQLGKDTRTDTKWMRARANWFSYLVVADRFGGPLVTGKPLSETDSLDPNYIRWIRTASIQHLREQEFDRAGVPDSLLYMLLRHATLLEYVRLAYDFLIANRIVEPYERYEREFSNLVDLPMWDNVWTHLLTGFPGLTNNLPLGEYLLSDLAAPQYKEPIRNYHAHLEALEGLSTAELERLFTETLDVCSHRIDAWVTSLAKKRIEEIRAAEPAGCHLAGFAWVENLRPAPPGGFSGGYIHSPSMTHAAAAAVLRNAYLTRGGMSRTEYAIDLSSSRVRTARWLLDSVRNGQPLGAVLGYQFERGLHEMKKEIYIAPLRKLYPLVADKGSISGEPVEAIAARNVVDGLRLRKAWRENSLPYGKDRLPAKDYKPFQAELQRLDDAVDAVADLLTAESVYQMVRGNTAASAATLDAMAQGLRPPDPEIVRTPRSGLSLTHRVLLVVGAKPLVSLSDKWRKSLTPRATAEPRLDAWAGSVLGDPEQVRCRVSVPDPAETDPHRRREIQVTLADLNLRPLDVLALAKTSTAGAEDSELDRCVASAALKGSTPSDVRIIYEAASGWDRRTVRTFPDMLELAGAINAVISGARPLKPEDLTPPEKGSGGTTDSDDAARRASDAAGALGALRGRLDGALKDPNADLRAPLTEASLFGVQSAFPPVGKVSRDALVPSASSVLAEIDRRLAKIKKDGPDAVKLATGNLQAVFGEDFVLLPQITVPSPEELASAMANSPSTDPKPKALAVEAWFQQAAPVRPPLERWRRFRLYAEAVGVPYKNPDLAQLPFRDKDIGAPWVGSSLPTTSFAGKISLVIYRAAKPDSREKWTGLLIDEWTEIIPQSEQSTAVAFHYDNPGAEAPQTILLAVHPKPSFVTRSWDGDTLISIIDETFTLAKARAVDGELLGSLAALRPPILLADSSVDPAMAPNVATSFAGKLISDPVIG